MPLPFRSILSPNLSTSPLKKLVYPGKYIIPSTKRTSTVLCSRRIPNSIYSQPIRTFATQNTLNESKWTASRTRRSIIATILTISTTAAVGLALAPRISYLEASPIPAFRITTWPASVTTDKLQDEDNRIAVRTKTPGELLLSMLVYKLCTTTTLVDMAPTIISIAEKVGLGPAVYWIIRRTFFVKFCGGETAEDCLGTMHRLSESGIGSILDLSIEADLDEEENTIGEEEAYAKWNERADKVAEMTKLCLDTTATQPNSFAAVKVTSMSSPNLLQDVSEVLVALRKEFENVDKDNDNTITLAEFKSILGALPNPPQDLDAAVKSLLPSQPKTISWSAFSQTLFIDNPFAREFFISSASSPSRIPSLTHLAITNYDIALARIRTIASYARHHHVRLMIDAEQSYFQPAIDHIALLLEKEFNHGENGAVVFNTYQMYLKSSLRRLQEDEARAREEGFVFGAKLVRGAYLVLERRRATDLGLPDPIHDTLQDTHNAYNTAVDVLLDRLAAHPSQVVFMVASHNLDSISRTVKAMEERGITAQAGTVLFGQLFGMCDRASYTLGRDGYSVFKYVPYGSIAEVIPYLIRRAQENSSILGGVAVEQKLIWNELRERLFEPGKRIRDTATEFEAANGAA